MQAPPGCRPCGSHLPDPKGDGTRGRGAVRRRGRPGAGRGGGRLRGSACAAGRRESGEAQERGLRRVEGALPHLSADAPEGADTRRREQGWRRPQRRARPSAVGVQVGPHGRPHPGGGRVQRLARTVEASGGGSAFVGGEPFAADVTQAQVPCGAGAPGGTLAVQGVSGQFGGGNVGQRPPLGHAGASFLRPRSGRLVTSTGGRGTADASRIPARRGGRPGRPVVRVTRR